MSEPIIDGRGFKKYDEIPSTYGGFVKIGESSAASAPHVWLWAHAPVSLNEPDGEQAEADLHLTLDSARLLRDQLTHLIDNHYQES